MVRTDEIVLNDNICLLPGNDLGAIGFDGATSNIGRKYYCIHNLSAKPHVWDFSVLKTDIQKAVTDGKRYIPRLFTACSANTSPKLIYKHKNTKTGIIEENRIDFPVWIADLMASDPSAQWLTNSPAEQKESYWLLDYNVPSVRAAVIEGIHAFGEWMQRETVINPSGKQIPISQAILYIEFNPLGSWGEGQMSPLQFTCTADDMILLWKEFMGAAPDNVITTGGMITDSDKGLELTERIHKLRNNAGRYGFTIEHLGAVDQRVLNGLYDKYAGKVFFSGEGAGWYKNSYWGGDCYLNMIEYLTRLQFSYARVQNWTFEDANLNPIKNIHDTAYKSRQMLAFLGYRYVLTPTYCEWLDNNTFRTHLAISNIGSSRCWWNFYETHIILTDDKGKILCDKTIELDIAEALPRNPLGLYSLGSTNDINTAVDVDVSKVTESFNVYIRVVDKYGIAKPLYFSNYGRVKAGMLEGAYRISSYNSKTQQWKADQFIKTAKRP